MKPTTPCPRCKWPWLWTAGNLGEFFQRLTAQNFYPPGVTWLKALVFWLWGGTAVTARLFSAVCLFLALPVLYAICLEIDERYGWLSGLIAASLTATMTSLLVNGTLVMLETPGLLVSLLALWAYVRAGKRPSSGRLFLASFCLILTVLTKYTYGAVTVTAVVLSANWCLFLAMCVMDGVPLPWRRWAALFAPLAVVLLLWLARPGSLSGVLDYAQPLAGDGNAWLCLARFAYYPLSLARFETPAPLFALVNLAGLVWALVNWRKPGIQLLLGYFLVGMALIMFINHPFNPRFIATFVPALHVMTAVMLTNLLLPLRHRWRQAVPLLLGGLLLLAGWQSAQTLPQRFALFGSRLEVEYETQPVLNELAAWLEEEISPNGRFLLINPWDQFSAEALSWRLAAEHQTSWIVPSLVSAARHRRKS
jgi:4-amino-4-deoxy-L-arabinose transferase-like glycosyltransferase